MKKWVFRIACRKCTFIGQLRPLGNIREEDDVCFQITRQSLEKASLRILGRRFHKSKNTILKIVHRVTARLPDSRWIAKQFCPSWSGILIFDGKVIRVFDALSTRLKRSSLSEDEVRWLHKMRWLVGVDFGTGDLPHYDLAQSESRIELVIYFKILKSVGYPLKAVVCDGNADIPRAARFVFGKDVVIQLCTRHFIKGLKRLLPADGLSDGTRKRLEKTISLIQSVIESNTIEEAGKNLQNLKLFSSSFRHPLKMQCIKLFQRHKQELCAHFLHPELHLPHTSNDAENLIRQLNQRLKILGRFFSRHYAKDYLNAWALLRRFTPFTDCRGTRRYRNVKAPLELAGCEIKNIDPLKLKHSNRELGR